MKQERPCVCSRTAVLFVMLAALCCLCSAASAGHMLLPQKVTKIPEEAFYGNKALDEVELTAPLEYIGHRAFAESSAHYVYIPDSVKTIEDDAFDNCPKLVCLVAENSYARQWCDDHGVRWKNEGYASSIVPSVTSVTVKSGQKKKITATTKPVGAASRLLWVSSNNKIFTVDQNGEIFGNYPGEAYLVVSSWDGSVTARVTVKVQANYRAVLFSESTFDGQVIQRNRGDVQLMKKMLASVTGPDGGKYTVTSFDDLVESSVYSKIDQLLVNPSRDGDVSIFFFASHGDYRSTTQKYAGRLWCKNRETWLELPTLAQKLSGIKGKVIVLLESCGPGAAVHEFKSNSGPESYEDDTAGADAILSAFSSADPGLNVYQPGTIAANDTDDKLLVEQYLNGTLRANDTTTSGNLFLTEKFIVMTAAAYRQMSYMYGGDVQNLFPAFLTRGVGTSGIMPADKECGNNDGKLTVNELYQYVYKKTRYKQTPQVYPKNSSYVLFLRAQ